MFPTVSEGGIPREKSSGFEMSTSTLPASASAPATSSAAIALRPSVALNTMWPCAAASASVTSETFFAVSSHVRTGGPPAMSLSLRASVALGSRVPSFTEWPIEPSLPATVFATMPEPRTAMFMFVISCART